MRYIVVVGLLVAGLSLGCNKPKNAEVAATAEPPRPVAAPLPPVEPAAPAKVEEQPEPLTPPTSVAAPAPSGEKTYTVQKGDTFYGIARKLYGDQRKAKEIMALNPGIEPGKLQPGQVIKVPE